MSEDTRDVVTAVEAARLLGVSRQRVHALYTEGKLAGFLDNKRLLLDATAVIRRAEGREPIDQHPDRLTVRQVAEALGVVEETVRKYHHRGLLRGGAKLDGYHITFPADVLDDFVAPVVGVRRRMQPYNMRLRRPRR